VLDVKAAWAKPRPFFMYFLWSNKKNIQYSHYNHRSNILRFHGVEKQFLALLLVVIVKVLSRTICNITVWLSMLGLVICALCCILPLRITANNVF
jgi:hypothetical protein